MTEQMDLIDVTPENQKDILATAKAYKKVQKRRIEALAEEKTLKTELLELIRQADLQPVDGKISVNVDGYTITVTPRDELVRVKDNSDDEADE